MSPPQDLSSRYRHPPNTTLPTTNIAKSAGGAKRDMSNYNTGNMNHNQSSAQYAPSEQPPGSHPPAMHPPAMQPGQAHAGAFQSQMYSQNASYNYSQGSNPGDYPGNYPGHHPLVPQNCDLRVFYAWHMWYRDYMVVNGLLAPGAPYPHAWLPPWLPPSMSNTQPHAAVPPPIPNTQQYAMLPPPIPSIQPIAAFPPPPSQTFEPYDAELAPMLRTQSYHAVPPPPSLLSNQPNTRYPIIPDMLNAPDFVPRIQDSWTGLLTLRTARAFHTRHSPPTSNRVHLAADHHTQSGMNSSVELASNEVENCEVNTADSASPATSPSRDNVSAHHQEDERPSRGRQLIMLPAPNPTDQYLAQASLSPEVASLPDKKLVILDLNGTLIFRPNPKRPRRMVTRPSLQEFLHYLFSEFHVMVWSSAKPSNVEVLVELALQDYSRRLVARWARNAFRLSPENYTRRVQVYKNLDWVWESGDIQRKKEGYPDKKFSQENTILIDDSALKGSIQPYNLLQIPAYEGETTGPDILAEVAGYLEVLKAQQDVSKFIAKKPFEADGTWKFDWGVLGPMPNESEMHEGPEADVMEGELEGETEEKDDEDDEEPQVTYVY